ncbi:MAG: TonB-dependent receptor [Mariniphaga sp.]|nr:TonB-dependent receptor [Mariniphaga sp.]
MKQYFFALIFLLAINSIVSAQETESGLKQVIRGVVVDKQSQVPLPGANVALFDSDISIGTSTNENGEFRLEYVPVGRQSIQVSFIGYFSATIKNLIVNSAKETVLFIELEEKVITTEEVRVIANIRKDQALNRMASVSARAFSVEEANRYAGTREDVARMAMNFAGVSGANDQRNDIIVRGNTPSGILWRLEDVDIPNPNHFAANGTTGGPVGMLNNNTLRNSDFYSGAFPAEYANVFSGVFDLNMREGNNKKYEFLGQLGFNGFELGAEGPFSKKQKSSFLINYRYSTLDIFHKLGINFGTSGIPRYQDLSFKLNFPVKKGKITWFGLAGKSSILSRDSEKNSTDLYTPSGTDLYSGSKSMAAGLTYARFHNENSYSKFVLSYVSQNLFTDLDSLSPENIPSSYFTQDNTEDKVSFKYIFNTKFNRQFSNRSGLTIDRLGYNLATKVYKSEWKYILDENKPVWEGASLYRAYTQFVYKFSDRLDIKPGVSAVFLGLNNSFAFEPRFGLNWKTGFNSSLNFGYGLQSKIQSLATYYFRSKNDNGVIELTNYNLDFTKAHHWVLGFDALISPQLRIKAESYYQYLFDVPVEAEFSGYSLLNEGAYWGLNTRKNLVNGGEGWNYGLELTLEKFYSKNYYFLLTTSLFDSKYKGSDGVKRNTAFNGNFVVNALIGKEIPINKSSTLVFDLKVTWAGGKRDTPIDLEASRQNMETFPTVYIESEMFSIKHPDYFKADMKIGFRKDGKKVSQVWEFYVENVTNHKNVLNRTYNRSKNVIEDLLQLGFFPVGNYKIYF